MTMTDVVSPKFHGSLDVMRLRDDIIISFGTFVLPYKKQMFHQSPKAGERFPVDNTRIKLRMKIPESV